MEDINNKPDKAKLTLLTIFTSFLKLGLTSFGGPAMIPQIRRMVVEKKQWLQEEIFQHGIAICQTVPGVITMNTAAYAGLKIRGIAGAAVAYIGFGLPSFLIILILSVLYFKFSALPALISVFTGLKMVVIAIMAEATLSFGKQTVIGWREIIITLFAAIMFGLGINPVIVIIASAIIGNIVYINKTIKTNPIEPELSSYSMKPVLYILAAVILGFILMAIFRQDLLTLSTVMMKISVFSFGGGYTSVPLMFHEFVEVRHWLTESMFLDGMVLGQVTPGPIAITSTFIGYTVYGFAGAVVGILSMLLPSILLLIIVVPYFARMNKSVYFNKAIHGILCAFVGLLLTVTIRFATGIEWGLIPILFTIAAFIVLLFRIEILWVVLGGAILSILLFR